MARNQRAPKLTAPSGSGAGDSVGRDLLLADHKYFSDSLWKNEKVGEARLRFVIVIVTGLLALIGALSSGQVPGVNPGDIVPFILFALSAMIMLGMITLMRMIKRNEVTDEYKKALDEIREQFRKADSSGVLDGYVPFRGRSGGWKYGGLAHTVAVLNSIVLAGFAGLASSSGSMGINAVVFVTLASFVAGLALQFYIARRK